MTEAELQSAVIDLARYLGYEHYHTHNSRRSPAGFPDLVLVHRTSGRLIFAELKSATGRLSDHQRGWLHWLGIAHEVHVWTPNNWAGGHIHAALKGAPPADPLPPGQLKVDDDL